MSQNTKKRIDMEQTVKDIKDGVVKSWRSDSLYVVKALIQNGAPNYKIMEEIDIENFTIK